MSVKRGGLGRNLSALLTSSPMNHSLPLVQETENDVSMVLKRPITSLQPGKYQPRGDIDENTLTELADSIKQQGLLQPLVVREISPLQYEIIAGERRWRACQLVGLNEVPVIIRQVDDETAMALALIENIQREDLNVLDQARAMQRLTVEFGLTHQEIAKILSKSRTVVSNYLRLLQLHSDVRRMLENGDLDMGHARCLLILDETIQLEIAHLVVAKGLSVRETEALVARVKTGKKEVKHPIEAPLFLKEQIMALEIALKTRVKLRPGKAGKGSLVIQYHDVDFLEKMIEKLGIDQSFAET